MTPRLVCIDLDGTILPDTTVSKYLSEKLGGLDDVEALEAQFARGMISNREIADFSARQFKDRPLSDVEGWLSALRVIGGLEEAIAAFRAQGAHIVLGTVTWSFAGRYFARRFGFEAYSGTEMGEADGVLLGYVTRHFNEDDKADWVQKLAGEFGVGLEECLAIGDSRSDIPLFRRVGCAVALNASPAAREAADTSLDTDDFMDVVRRVS